jgi:prepilin-type N-terminal cleavage/methylation domain-containing protein
MPVEGETMQPKTPVGVRNDSGFTLIDLLFVIALIGLLSTLAIPGLMKARGAAQASSALGTIRVINSGQLSYAISCGLGFYAPDLPTLAKKPAGSIEGFLAPELGSGPTVMRSGYIFSMAITPVAGTPGTCNGLGPGQTGPGYALVADPLSVEYPPRYFGTNADAVIYEHSKTLSATMPETGAPPAGFPLK